ncbi:MAG: DMT family transporter [Candidatus Hodarchaeales archaeon]|jgi:drug/metabolite transporter (DMT)-like permease
MDPQEQKELILGPAIVAGANAMRAFDAPVRYPLVLTNTSSVSSRSIFIVLIEHLIGTLLVTILLFSRKANKLLLSQLRSFNKRDWLSLVGVSLGSGLGLYFFMLAFGYGNPTVAILLQKSQPLITLFFAMVLLQERPTKIFYISLIIAFFGIYLMVVESFGAESSDALLAALFSLVAAIFWGSNTVWGRILTDKVDYWNLTTLRYIGGSVILIGTNLIVGAYTPENFEVLSSTLSTFGFAEIPINGFLAIALVTIFTGGILPLSLYYFGLRWSRASVGGVAELAFPVLAIFVNFFFFGWGISELQLVGAIILFAVVSVMAYVNKVEHVKAQETVSG